MAKNQTSRMKQPMSLKELQAYCENLELGEIEDSDEVERLLLPAWDELDGSSAGGMTADKLLCRAEQFSWDPPCLTFVIERHGITAMGSSRATFQRWLIDVERGTANFAESGYRQVRPCNPRLDVSPLVAEVVSVIVNRCSDPRVVFSAGGGVRVIVGKIITADAPKQTVAGRRKRFRSKLKESLEQLGWTESSPHNFIYGRRGSKSPSK